MMQKATPAEPWKVSEKTPVQKKTINPTWNHRMTFSIALDSTQIVAAPDKVHAIMCATPRRLFCRRNNMFVAATIGINFRIQNLWAK
jgi:hypothetical protein